MKGGAGPPRHRLEEKSRLARLPGLGAENVSFLFKIMHQILPTKEQIARATSRSSPACPAPGCGHASEDLPHALVLCEGNDGVGTRMMNCLRYYVPNIVTDSALRLEIEVDEDMELPLVWLMGTVCQVLWKLRLDKTRVHMYEIRSQLEAKINLLRETRYSSSAEILDQLVVSYFN